jgi:O-antigen ligase
MVNFLQELKKITFYESILLLFPLFLIFGNTFVNFILVLATLCVTYELFKNKYFYIFKETWVIYFLIFILYNIFRSFFATDSIIALQSSFSLIRFLFFSLFLLFCIPNIKNFQIIIKYWIIILILVCLDTLIQFFFLIDIFGFKKGMDGLRLSGPFGRRLIVGAYLSYLTIPLIYYFFSKFKNYNFTEKIFFYLLYFLLFFTIALTGERLSFITFLCSSTLIFFFYLTKKNFAFLLSLIFFILTAIYYFSTSFQIRVNQFYFTIIDIENSPWGILYYNAYQIFKDNFFFGVGLKNYSIVCDSIYKYPDACSTHPHNFYLEILTETGFFGFLTLSLTFVNFLFSLSKKNNILRYNKIYKEYKGLLYGNILILLIYIWPIKTSGRFFTTWNGSFFWLNLGIILLITKSAYKKNNF